MGDSVNLLSEVDLDLYLQHKGFELIKKESSRKWRKYIDKVSNAKYLVSRNDKNGQYFYCCPQKDNTYKNIFDFCREEEGITGTSTKEREKKQIIGKKMSM